jgi:nitrogen fixation NifU-like protein
VSEIDELYQEVILHHSRKPRNFGVLEDANRSADGYNPLCGDRLHLSLRLEDGVVRDLRFVGEGCAISKASASVMTEVLKGRPEDEARALFRSFHDMVTGSPTEEPGAGLGKLDVFAGVRRFPVRVKCAMLPWRTLESALANEPETVTTETEES